MVFSQPFLPSVLPHSFLYFILLAMKYVFYSNIFVYLGQVDLDNGRWRSELDIFVCMDQVDLDNGRWWSEPDPV